MSAPDTFPIPSTRTPDGMSATATPGSKPAADRRVNPRTRIHLSLQQQASSNLQRHVLRRARRLFVILAGDIFAFAVMRGFVQLVRDQALLGETFARIAQTIFARGILNGPQYAVAL